MYLIEIDTYQQVHVYGSTSLLGMWQDQNDRLLQGMKVAP